MRARQNRQPDELHVLVNGGARDLRRPLPDSRIDHFVALISKQPRDHLGPAIMTIKAGLRH
jgi:hypothetical protein